MLTSLLINFIDNNNNNIYYKLVNMKQAEKKIFLNDYFSMVILNKQRNNQHIKQNENNKKEHAQVLNYLKILKRKHINTRIQKCTT